MWLPFDGMKMPILRISSFGDSLEFAFFGALTPVGALFDFGKEKDNGNKQFSNKKSDHTC